MTSYLFLGGTEDGEILHVDPELWNVRILVSNTALNSGTSFLEVGEENYTRRRLVSGTGTETFEVFAPSDWTGDMLMRHLLLRARKAQEMQVALTDLVEAVGRGDEVGLPEAYRAALDALNTTKEA